MRWKLLEMRAVRVSCDGERWENMEVRSSSGIIVVVEGVVGKMRDLLNGASLWMSMHPGQFEFHMMFFNRTIRGSYDGMVAK